MTDAPNRSSTDSARTRQNRLRDALRENLKRRKSQARGRVDHAAKVSEDSVGEKPDPEREQIDDAR